MPKFEVVSEYQPSGDQPQAIAELVEGFKEGNQFETLLGVTGSGKKAMKGTGGNFSYYELGEKLLDGEYLNEAVPISEIRQYVYFTETKERVKENSEEPYQLGVYLDTAYYFYYEKDKATISPSLCTSNTVTIESCPFK